MLVIDVDDVHTEPLQARLAGLHDVGGAAIDAIGLTLAPHLAEFRNEHDTITSAFDGATEHLLIVTPAVHVRGIEMIDAFIDGAPDQVLELGIVGGTVHTGQGHAAQSDGRDGEPLGTEGAVRNLFHMSSRPQ